MDSVDLVLEYLKGGELFLKIQEKGSYSEGDAARVMKQLLEVVDYCHSKNVIHRDIKPENIILRDTDSDLDFKLIDFGFATVTAPGVKEFLKYGSPGYVAPEIISKQGYTSKADIFSCGIIMCFLLTGTTPFASGTVQGIMDKNKACEINTEGPVWQRVSLEAKDLVLKMTERDPEKRITAAAALTHPWFCVDFKYARMLTMALRNMKQSVQIRDESNSSLRSSNPISSGACGVFMSDAPAVSPRSTKKKLAKKGKSQFKESSRDDNSSFSYELGIENAIGTVIEYSCHMLDEEECIRANNVPDFTSHESIYKRITLRIPEEGLVKSLPTFHVSLASGNAFVHTTTDSSVKKRVVTPTKKKKESSYKQREVFTEIVKLANDTLGTTENRFDEDKNVDTPKIPLNKIAIHLDKYTDAEKAEYWKNKGKDISNSTKLKCMRTLPLSKTADSPKELRRNDTIAKVRKSLLSMIN